jgi:hypothetical protein
MDYAFRRRFKFIQVLPKVEVLDELLGDAEPGLKKKVKRLFVHLNQKLAEINPDLCLGHSYFRSWPGEKFTAETLAKVWELSIQPLIQEYFYSEARVAQFSLKTLLNEIENSALHS